MVGAFCSVYVSSYRVCFQLSSDAYPFVCYLSTRTPHEPYGGVHGTFETQRIVYQAQWRGVHEQRRRRAASCIDILPGSRYPQHYDFVYLESEMAEKALNKLARTFATQMEALNRYRGKGQQKMTVEHVHVHDGGQAIVGQVAQGGGATEKDKGQSHAIGYAPGETLRSEDKKKDAVPVTSDAKR